MAVIGRPKSRERGTRTSFAVPPAEPDGQAADSCCPCAVQIDIPISAGGLAPSAARVEMNVPAVSVLTTTTVPRGGHALASFTPAYLRFRYRRQSAFAPHDAEG